MSYYPEDLRYLDSHEYVRLDGEIATIGITEFAVQQLGEIVFVELPNQDARFEKGDEVGTIESVKAVAQVYTPISGTVIECNTTREDSPEIISEDPYGEGWLIKVQVDNLSDLDDTLSADQYQALVEGI
ncbi:Glycine cleavage system H protein [Planktothrix serta PCC 8927]|uniref:Glycine cleavage system H protein n=1 Tax=Planktothrix serta PCC 8927 TaxID=671068 RepID=A0A7Z9BKU2_9CYAN|nr:glycine cleavage system protein GcvH [Planktothrix serta]VXD16236.1 Glycine cleavage system H protein [Planktothrix serta PCC 8927]